MDQLLRWAELKNVWFLLTSYIIKPLGYSKICKDWGSLQLALNSARFEFTLKMRLNRIMTERPNICYIFEKLSVQGCQIWHSYVSLMQSVSSLLLPLPHWKTCFCEALTSICSNFWGDHSLDVATSKDRQNDTRCNNFHIVTIVTQWFREVIKKRFFTVRL